MEGVWRFNLQNLIRVGFLINTIYHFSVEGTFLSFWEITKVWSRHYGIISTASKAAQSHLEIIKGPIPLCLFHLKRFILWNCLRLQTVAFCQLERAAACELLRESRPQRTCVRSSQCGDRSLLPFPRTLSSPQSEHRKGAKRNKEGGSVGTCSIWNGSLCIKHLSCRH